MAAHVPSGTGNKCFAAAPLMTAALMLIATGVAGFNCGGDGEPPAPSAAPMEASSGEDAVSAGAAAGPDSAAAPSGAAPDAGEAQHSVPADFELIVGSGGGFTGHWSGFLIEGDGRVWSWSGIGVPTDTTLVGDLPADSLIVLWTAIGETTFFDEPTGETGNVTAVLEVTGGGRTARSTWIPSVEAAEPPKTPVEAVYRRARTMAAGAAE